MTLWRHRDFLLLWGGESVSQVGTMVSHLALPLLAATALGATPWEMGLLVAAERGAFLLVGLPVGVLLDRVRRRPVMIAADLVRFALIASIPLAWALDVLTFGQLLAVALLAGIATVFFDVGYQSVLPAVVGRGGLVEGNAKLESTRAAAEATGPALGGGLVQLVGAAAAVLVDAVSYLVSAAFLALMRTRETATARDPARSLVAPAGSTGRISADPGFRWVRRRTAPRIGHTRPVRRRGQREAGPSRYVSYFRWGPLGAEMAYGLRYVLGHPLLRPIALCTGTGNLFGGVLSAVSVLFLARELGQPPAVVGLALAAGGAAGVVGALTAGGWIRLLGQARTVVTALLVTGPVALVLPMTTPGAGLAWFALGTAAIAYGGVVYNVAQVSFRQSVCPDRLLGRMNASIRFLVWGTIPVGGLLGGALGELIGLRATLLVAAVGLMLSPVWVVASPLRRLRDLPTEAVSLA